MKKSDCGLLPHITETLYGFNRSLGQIYGWEIQKFNIPNEWQFSQGEKVKIAVIDTGCDLYHDDIKDNIIQGKNFINSKKDPIDDNGHGTHVCGTIAARNNKLGIVGVAPMSKIIPIKALDSDGAGNNIVIAKAIRWAVSQKANIITMSLGSEYDNLEIKKAIDTANKKGCTVFCAAGNSGHDHDIMYPAKYDSTIAIGSIDSNLCRSKFSCAGNSLDFLAPGENILGCAPNNNYVIMSGTSMANPFAVGCASLLYSYAKKQNIVLRSKIDYINFFKSYTTKLSQKQFLNKKYQGYGILQPVCSFLNKKKG